MSTPGAIRRPVLVAHARLRWDKIRDQHQLVYPEGLLELNSSAAAIVGLMDGRTIPQIVDALRQDFEGEPQTDEILSLLQTLSERGLLRDGIDDA